MEQQPPERLTRNRPINHEARLHRRRSSRAAPGEKFDDFIRRRKTEIEQENERVSIFRSPILVVSYFAMFAFYEARSLMEYVYRHRNITFFLFACAPFLYIAYQIEGPHRVVFQHIQRTSVWYGWWVILGVASAFGLGTGLHTFLLFLGPYIAEVTMAAHDCHGVDFLTRDPTTHRLQCALSNPAVSGTLSLWAIFKLIRWESFAWGAGTALGELPPYFVARAVALSGGKSDELADFESGLSKAPEDRSLKETVSLMLYSALRRLGFLGILLFASIPNPLFDLAGITCGHFLIPFATFFGATFIGKACVKASLQSLIVILAFSSDTLSVFLGSLQRIAPALHNVVEKFIREQTHRIGHPTEEDAEQETNAFGVAWNLFLSLMLCYFVISSIESLGLAYMKRERQAEVKRLERQRQQKPTTSVSSSSSTSVSAPM